MKANGAGNGPRGGETRGEGGRGEAVSGSKLSTVHRVARGNMQRPETARSAIPPFPTPPPPPTPL